MEGEPRNTHHFFYEGRWYKQKPFNALRQFVVARNVLVVPHNNLHAETEPPLQPSRPLAWGILNHLNQAELSHPLDAAFETVSFLHRVGNAETMMIAENLTDQLGYLVGSYE